MSNRDKLRREAQNANTKLGEVAKKPYGLLKLVGIGAFFAIVFVVLALSLNNANAAEKHHCPRDVIATPEPGLPDGAILYQVFKVYCVHGGAWVRGMDKASPPIPQPTGQRCDMSKPFILAGAGKPV